MIEPPNVLRTTRPHTCLVSSETLPTSARLSSLYLLLYTNLTYLSKQRGRFDCADLIHTGSILMLFNQSLPFAAAYISRLSFSDIRSSGLFTLRIFDRRVQTGVYKNSAITMCGCFVKQCTHFGKSISRVLGRGTDCSHGRPKTAQRVRVSQSKLRFV